jgi:hypothetical protein
VSWRRRATDPPPPVYSKQKETELVQGRDRARSRRRGGVAGGRRGRLLGFGKCCYIFTGGGRGRAPDGGWIEVMRGAGSWEGGEAIMGVDVAL